MIKILITLVSFVCCTHMAENICHFDNVCLFNATEYEHTYSDSCKPCVCNKTCNQGDICDIKDDLEPGQEKCVHQIEFYGVSNEYKILFNIHRDLRRWYNVVLKCPNGSDASEKTACESNENPNNNRYVSSVTTYRVYKNEMCAKCNGEYNFTKWTSAISINSKRVFNLFNKDPTDTDILNYVSNKMVFSLPPEGYPEKLNECSGDIINSCNATGRWDYLDENLIRLCRSSKLITQYVGTANKSLYKNVYCALCNSPRQELFDGTCKIGDISHGKIQLPFLRLLAWNDDTATATATATAVDDDDDDGADDNVSHCLNNQMLDPLDKVS
ncbi:hypothetical protein ACF0H5_024370 [Mactra antiquata]